MKSLVYAVLVAVVVAAALGLAAVYGGLVPVAAVGTESAVVKTLLHTAYEKAVARSARNISVPGDLSAAERVLRGAYNFQAMCSGCHTPPGRERSVQAQGMNPQPPDLTAVSGRRTPAEAYWVMTNGVRMTAMPAFGPTHADEEIWALVAFLQRARNLSGAEYGELVSQARAAYAGGDGHGHSHGSSMGGDMMPGEHEHGDDDHHDAGEEAHHHDGDFGHDTDSEPLAASGPGAIAERLRLALADGDEAEVRALLAPDVLIFESGGVESGLNEYAGHHMPADMAFLEHMTATPLTQKRFEFDDRAVVATRSRLTGEYHGKAVDLISTETLLLERHDGQWRVAHIHWSSGPAQ